MSGRRSFAVARRMLDGSVQLVAVAFTEEAARRLCDTHSAANPRYVHFVRKL